MDDAKVIKASLQGDEKVFVLVGVYIDSIAAGEYELEIDDIVRHKTLAT